MYMIGHRDVACCNIVTTLFEYVKPVVQQIIERASFHWYLLHQKNSRVKTTEIQR